MRGLSRLAFARLAFARLAFARLAFATCLVAGFGGAASAQPHLRRAYSATASHYDALSEGRGGQNGGVGNAGAVPPSESHTVMGLRVPR